MTSTKPAKPFLAALAGERQARPPVWLMRQAGRYLPEYREIRAKATSFLDFCYAPAFAVEATLQPIRRFGFDAAIVFSDILVVPDALGQSVTFETGEGPRLDPICDAEGLKRLRPESGLAEARAGVRDAGPGQNRAARRCGADRLLRRALDGCQLHDRRTRHAGPSPGAPVRLSEPVLFAALIDRLVSASAEYLLRQIAAGAEAVQIFNSWAGVLPPAEFERWCLAPIAALVGKVKARAPRTPVIAFPRGAATELSKFADLEGIAAIGLDTGVEPRAAVAALPGAIALQGNLDPLALVAGGAALDQGVDRVLAGFAGRSHIFNLGHGILPETPIAHVERMLKRVRGQ